MDNLSDELKTKIVQNIEEKCANCSHKMEAHNKDNTCNIEKCDCNGFERFSQEIQIIDVSKINEIWKKIKLTTLDERKKLGINKSTSWYLKKNLKNDKSFKI